MKIKKRMIRAWNWYVRGDYHCDKCPYCWCETCGYEDDADAGCYIKGELCDSCRLLPPFRFLLGWGKKKRYQYAETHEWDGLVDFYTENQKNCSTMYEVLQKHLEDYEFCYVAMDGEYRKNVDLEDILIERCAIICEDYESAAHPVTHQRLSAKWKELFKETFERLKRKFEPYFQ